MPFWYILFIFLRTHLSNTVIMLQALFNETGTYASHPAQVAVPDTSIQSDTVSNSKPTLEVSKYTCLTPQTKQSFYEEDTAAYQMIFKIDISSEPYIEQSPCQSEPVTALKTHSAKYEQRKYLDTCYPDKLELKSTTNNHCSSLKCSPLNSSHSAPKLTVESNPQAPGRIFGNATFIEKWELFE